MKNIIIILLLIPTLCFADEFTFEWDYESEDIDGFRIYSGPMGQDESGNWYPQLKPDPLIDNIPPDARKAMGSEVGWIDQSKKFCFVARAYKDSEESTDSNMVCAVIDNTPLNAPENVIGVWDKSTETITLSWTQSDYERAKFWNIYYKIGDDSFAEFGTVKNDGQTILTIEKTFSEVGQGETTAVSFAVVAYKDFDVYSPNSAETIVIVDRSIEGPPPPVENFKFSVEIPVK